MCVVIALHVYSMSVLHLYSPLPHPQTHMGSLVGHVTAQRPLTVTGAFCSQFSKMP